MTKERAEELRNLLSNKMAGCAFDWRKHRYLKVPLPQPLQNLFTPDDGSVCGPSIETIDYHYRDMTWFENKTEFNAGIIEAEGIIVGAWYVDDAGKSVPLPEQIGQPAP